MLPLGRQMRISKGVCGHQRVEATLMRLRASLQPRITARRQVRYDPQRGRGRDRMRPLIALGVVACGLALANTAAITETRVALIVGNSAYQNAPALANPLNDARDMSAAQIGRASCRERGE